VHVLNFRIIFMLDMEGVVFLLSWGIEFFYFEALFWSIIRIIVEREYKKCQNTHKTQYTH
jgi:hypothetical protein